MPAQAPLPPAACRRQKTLGECPAAALSPSRPGHPSQRPRDPLPRRTAPARAAGIYPVAMHRYAASVPHMALGHPRNASLPSPQVLRSRSGLPPELHMLHAHRFNDTVQEPEDGHLQTPVTGRRCTSSERRPADILITTLPKRLQFRAIRIHRARNPRPYRLVVIRFGLVNQDFRHLLESLHTSNHPRKHRGRPDHLRSLFQRDGVYTSANHWNKHMVVSCIHSHRMARKRNIGQVLQGTGIHHSHAVRSGK